MGFISLSAVLGAINYRPAFGTPAVVGDDLVIVMFTVNDGTANSVLAVFTFTMITPITTGGMATLLDNGTYTFTAADFNYADVDGDTLASIKITSRPAAGALLNYRDIDTSGTPFTASALVTITATDLTACNIVYNPALGTAASAGLQQTFTFQVNDGEDDSTATTFALNVTPSDATAPLLTSLMSQVPTEEITTAAILTWRLVFNEVVRNVTPEDFMLNDTTTATLAVAEVDAMTTYDIIASSGNLARLDNTVTLSLASSQDIDDLADNAFAGDLPAGAQTTYILDNIPSPVNSFTASSPVTVAQSSRHHYIGSIGVSYFIQGSILTVTLSVEHGVLSVNEDQVGVTISPQ